MFGIGCLFLLRWEENEVRKLPRPRPVFKPAVFQTQARGPLPLARSPCLISAGRAAPADGLSDRFDFRFFFQIAGEFHRCGGSTGPVRLAPSVRGCDETAEAVPGDGDGAGDTGLGHAEIE